MVDKGNEACKETTVACAEMMNCGRSDAVWRELSQQDNAQLSNADVSFRISCM